MSGALGGILGALSSLGPNFYLTLGPITFEDHEIPSTLMAGGDQMLSVHKYPGGARTIDSFGPDDHDITWSGYFTDLDCESRCQQLDAMRRQGLPQPLNFSTFFYIVAIKSFTWTFERFWQIGYSITLTVLQDNTNPPTQAQGISFDDQVNSDAADAASNTTLMMGALY